MAYDLVPLIIAVAVVIAFVAVADVSTIAKILVVALLMFSLWCTFVRTEWDMIGLFIQVALGVFVLAYIRCRGRPRE